jgi:hypothetical protein
MSTTVPASENWRTYDSRPLKPNGWMCQRDMFERHAAVMVAHLEVIQRAVRIGFPACRPTNGVNVGKP